MAGQRDFAEYAKFLRSGPALPRQFLQLTEMGYFAPIWRQVTTYRSRIQLRRWFIETRLACMDLLLEIDGSAVPSADLDELRSIICSDDYLRSIRVDTRMSAPPDEAMGPVTDGLLLAIGSGGAGVTLLRLVAEWMQNRRSKVRVKLTSKSHTVELDVDAVDAPDKVVRILRELDPES